MGLVLKHDPEELGRVAFEGFQRELDRAYFTKTSQVRKTPKWAELNDDDKRAWIHAADTVSNHLNPDFDEDEAIEREAVEAAEELGELDR